MIAQPLNRPRRTLVRALLLLPLGSATVRAQPARPPLAPTPHDDWGPFYPPDWRGEIDADLTRFGAAVAEGTRLHLSGSVRRADGQPLADAVVEIWQTDARGRYRHPGVPEHLRDPGFQGFGRTLTDAAGAYAFSTIVPGRYGSRPPHIHIRVARPGIREFVSQIYFAGDNREGASRMPPPERFRLTVGLAGQDGRGLSARFDIVVEAS